MQIERGDDITIAGVVLKIENGCVLIRCQNKDEIWINPECIKTIRPHGNNGGGTRVLVRDDEKG